MGVREFGAALLGRLLDDAVAELPGAVGAGLALGEGEGFRPVAAVGVAAALDPLQREVGQGPLWDALARGREVVVPGEAAGVTRVWDAWPDLASRLGDVERDRVAGALVMPGEWGGELPVLFSLYLSVVPDREVVGRADRQESVVTQALALVEYCVGEEVRAEQMLHMSQYRRVIEQAKGLVMGATGTDAEQAFATLSRASQHFNVRLRALAVALVEHVTGAVEHPDDPALAVTPEVRERRAAVQMWLALTATPR